MGVATYVVYGRGKVARGRDVQKGRGEEVRLGAWFGGVARGVAKVCGEGAW